MRARSRRGRGNRGEGATGERVRIGVRVGDGLLGADPEPGRGGRGRGLDGGEPPDAGLRRLGQADPQVEAERPGYLVGDPAADSAAGDPLDQLAEEPAVGLRVVAVVGAGLPGGCLGGERGGAADAVDGLVRGERGVQDGQSGAVREQMADEDAFLAAWP